MTCRAGDSKILEGNVKQHRRGSFITVDKELFVRIASGAWVGAWIGAKAGLCAIGVTTLLNLAARAGGLLSPAMDLRGMAEMFVDPAAHPQMSLAMGIVLHTVSGVAEGGAYGFISRQRFSLASALIFMIGMWLVMMLVAFPLLHKGWFGLQGGLHVPVATFVLHLVFGALLGYWTVKAGGQRASAMPAALRPSVPGP